MHQILKLCARCSARFIPELIDVPESELDRCAMCGRKNAPYQIVAHRVYCYYNGVEPVGVWQVDSAPVRYVEAA